MDRQVAIGEAPHRSEATAAPVGDGGRKVSRRRLLCGPTPGTTPWTLRPSVDRWLDRPRTRFTYNARAALYHGLQALDLRPGDAVLFPAYCCGSELDVLLHAGLRPVFYRLGPGLVPDLDHLDGLRAPRLRALFVIHYLGLPQPMDSLRELTRRRGLMLIEDCAHALFARYPDGLPLGSRAALAVFSLRKHLPVPDGGLMLTCRGVSQEPAQPRLARIPWRRSARSLAYVTSTELEHRWPHAADRLRARLGLAPPPWLAEATASGEPIFPKTHRFERRSADWRMSIWARALLRLADAPAIRERRLANYRRIAGLLGDNGPVRPLAPHVPPCASPWIMPVLADAPASLCRFLAAHGVQARQVWRSAHPALPVERFPCAAALRRHVVAVPVHHGLSDADAQQVAELILQYRRDR